MGLRGGDTEHLVCAESKAEPKMALTRRHPGFGGGEGQTSVPIYAEGRPVHLRSFRPCDCLCTAPRSPLSPCASCILGGHCKCLRTGNCSARECLVLCLGLLYSWQPHPAKLTQRCPPCSDHTPCALLSFMPSLQMPCFIGSPGPPPSFSFLPSPSRLHGFHPKDGPIGRHFRAAATNHTLCCPFVLCSCCLSWPCPGTPTCHQRILFSYPSH